MLLLWRSPCETECRWCDPPTATGQWPTRSDGRAHRSCCGRSRSRDCCPSTSTCPSCTARTRTASGAERSCAQTTPSAQRSASRPTAFRGGSQSCWSLSPQSRRSCGRRTSLALERSPTRPTPRIPASGFSINSTTFLHPTSMGSNSLSVFLERKQSDQSKFQVILIYAKPPSSPLSLKN